MQYAYHSWFFIAEKWFPKQFSVLSTICNMGSLHIFVFRGEQKQFDRWLAKLKAGELAHPLTTPPYEQEGRYSTTSL